MMSMMVMMSMIMVMTALFIDQCSRFCSLQLSLMLTTPVRDQRPAHSPPQPLHQPGTREPLSTKSKPICKCHLKVFFPLKKARHSSTLFMLSDRVRQLTSQLILNPVKILTISHSPKTKDEPLTISAAELAASGLPSGLVLALSEGLVS